MVQERTGRSYSTVKERLVVWQQSREQEAAISNEIPADIRAGGDELTRQIWASVQRDAQRKILQHQNAADVDISMVRAEQLDMRNRELEDQLAATRAQAARIPDLEQVAVGLRDELHAAQQQLMQQTADNARLSGEAETLRIQVGELLAALRPPMPPVAG